MKYTASALAMVGMAATTVQGHGFLTSPKPRMPGDAFKAACGQQVYYNQAGDNYGNVQGELQVAGTQTDYSEEKCDIWLCKGFKYEDNKDLVQTYTPGQVVDFTFDIRAPHTGVANVSIVDTASNSIIGSALKSWDVFASTASSDYADEKSFSITIPDDLGDKCSTAGACVIQHWWTSDEVNQSYESCVDFTVGGSGSGSSSGSSSAASSAAATSSAVATSAAATSAAATSSVVANTQVASSATSAAASATSSAAAASSTGSSSMPADFTLSDALEWINYLYENGQTTYSSVQKRSFSFFG